MLLSQRHSGAGLGMHWFGLSEITWLAIVIVISASVIINRLARIAVILDGIYTIPWKQSGGPDQY